MSDIALMWTADVESEITGSPDWLPPRNQRNWAGLYLFLDVSARPPLADTFEAVAQRLAHGYEVFRPTHRYRLSWAVVVLGIRPSETRRWREVEEQFTQMWQRHPELLKQFHQGDQILAMWFVDGRKRPFTGYVQDKYNVHDKIAGLYSFGWDVCPDVRVTPEYQERYHPPSPHALGWRLALNAVSPEMLRYALGSRPRKPARGVSRRTRRCT
jgi:hypothetical protein